MKQRLPNDVTIEEIGDLLKSLNEVDMEELVNFWLDNPTKLKLKKVLQ